ncbi:MAG: DNA topoisomerase [Oscillospiraceae bacterium]
MSHKLIIAEKPSVAEAIAHTVGAREKVYAKESKNFCYEGNGYYVANAAGHLYGVGMPENYGFKEWNIETLPFFPELTVHKTDDKQGLRDMLTALMSRDDVDEIICATDAGREGELIFRHIYSANHCTKPVKRLWINSVTDEAIRAGLSSLKPMSDYDNMYIAALTREKLDWYIGMNLSRLYGVMDNYTHKIGRVKTPLLSIIAARDNEIKAFEPKTTYRLMLSNGAVSREEFADKAEAETVLKNSTGKFVNVIGAESKDKSENRPELYNLAALQMDANDILGLSAAETLDTAQRLYEQKLITYPRTDSRYISDDLIPQVESLVKKLIESGKYSDRSKQLLEKGLNLDNRIVDNSKISDHHAIIPTMNVMQDDSISDKDKDVLNLIINRLLMCVDTKYRYTETIYEFWCEDITYDLVCRKPIEMGWKAFRPKYDEDSEDNKFYQYDEGSTFFADVSLKECISQPKKHFTDKTLISVMENIDNRIDDKALKAAVNGKGIGTSATRAAIIEELISADYVIRKGKQIIATDFGREFIASLPDNLKSVERTAEWEQYFDDIQRKGISPNNLENDVKSFIKTTVLYEKSSGRKPLSHENPNAPKREIIGKCPRCGKNIYEGKLNFYCEGGKECGFSLWKRNNNVTSEITTDRAKKLLNGEVITLKAKTKEGEEYSAAYKIEDTGKYVNLVREKTEKKTIGKCPRCGKNIYEGKLNFYCESGKDGCGFSLWKEDKFNGVAISVKNAEELLSKGKTTIKKKTLDGTENAEYALKDTGKYINLVKQ